MTKTWQLHLSRLHRAKTSTHSLDGTKQSGKVPLTVIPRPIGPLNLPADEVDPDTFKASDTCWMGEIMNYPGTDR